MDQAKAEIAAHFLPSLPKAKPKDVPTGLPSTDETKTGFLGFFKRSPETPTAATEANTGTPDQTADDVATKTKNLYKLLLDKIDLETDIHRQAQKLVKDIAVSEEEVAKEIASGSWHPEIPLEKRHAIAEERIKRRKLQEVKSASAQQQVSLKDRIALAKQGRVREALGVSSSDQETAQRTMDEDKRKVEELRTQISALLQDPLVVAQYTKEYSEERLERLRKAREVHRNAKTIRQLELEEDRMERAATLEGRQLSSGEQQIINDNKEVAAAVRERIDDLKANPEVFDLVRLTELSELQRGLREHKFAETESRRAYIDTIREWWAYGERVLCTGPTGSGKTVLLKYASVSLFGEHPEIVSGHELITPYEIYGKMGGVREKGGINIIFKAAAAVKALRRNVPLIIDEINVIPNKILMRMKADWTVSVGQEISIQEDSDSNEKVGDRFAWGATANVKGEHHPDREELDDAIVRAFKPLKIEYFPPQELYDILLASQLDARGGIRMSPRDASETMAHLCTAAEWSQRLYDGQSVINPQTQQMLEQRGQQTTGRGALLQKAVFDPGTAIGVLHGWEKSRMKGMTLREHLNKQIVLFIRNENYPAEDRYQLTRVFALQGFLRGVNAGQLNVPELTQDVIDAWNGYDGKRYVYTPDYTPPETVAKLDPFGILKRPVSADVADLLGEETEQQEVVTQTGIPQAGFAGAARETGAATRPAQVGTRPAIIPTTGPALDADGQRRIDNLDILYPIKNPLKPDYEIRFDTYPKTLLDIATANETTIPTIIERMERCFREFPGMNLIPSDLQLYTHHLLKLTELAKTYYPNSLSRIAFILNQFDEAAGDNWKAEGGTSTKEAKSNMRDISALLFK